MIQKANKHIKNKRLDLALTSYIKALQRKSSVNIVYREIDELYNKIENDKKALELCNHVLALNPRYNKTTILYMKSLIEFNKKNFRNSLDHLNTAIKDEPSNIRFLYRKMKCLTKLAEFEEAMSISEIILELIPFKEVKSKIDEFNVALYLDMVAEILHLYSLIKEDEKFKKLTKTYPLSKVALGNYYFCENKYDLAIKYYKDYLTNGGKEGDWNVLNNIGFAYIEKKQYETAIDTLKNALDALDKEYYEFRFMGIKFHHPVKKDYSQSWGFLALAYYKKNNLEKAYDCISHAINLYPKLEFSWYILALVHTENKDNEKALDACEKALEINPYYWKVLKLKENLVKKDI